MALDLRLIANGGTFVEVDSAASDDTTGYFRSSAAATLDINALAGGGHYYRYMDGGGAGTYAGRGYMEGKFNLTCNAGDTWRSNTVGFGDSIGSLTQQVNFAGFFIGASVDTSINQPYVEIWQSSVEGGTALAVLSETTNYWYRTGFLSSIGGQYGAAFVQEFTDSGRTTLVAGGSKIAILTVAPSFRYVYTGMASTGNNGTLTGTHSDVTLFAPAAGIDLTTGVETDTGTGRLVVYPDCIVATALNVANSETAKHLAIDHGAAFFGDYKISGVLNVTAFATGTTLVPMFAILSVTDAAADARASNDLQGVNIYWLTSTTYAPYIHQSAGGTDTVSGVGPTLNTNQPYSFVLERSGTTLTLKIYNDLVLTNFAGTSQVSTTVTWTGRATTTYRYSMPVASTLNGATSRSSTFTLGGVQVQGGPPTVGYGASTSRLLSIGIAAGAKEFSYTAVNRLLNYSTSTHSKVAASDVVEMLRLLSLSEGANPNVVRTFARLRLLSSSSSTREGGASSAAVNKLLTSVTASKVSAGGTSGSLSVKVTITTIGYSGIFLKLISVGFTKANATTGILEPVTGLSPTLKIKRGTDGLSFDHNDKLFKTAAAAGANLTATMLETDPTYYPGTYNHFVQVNDFGAGENIVYQLWVQDTATGYFADGTIVFRDGVEQFGGMTVGQNTALITLPSAAATRAEMDANSTRLAAIDLATDTLEASMAALPSAVLAAAEITPISATIPTESSALTVGKFLALK